MEQKETESEKKKMSGVEIVKELFSWVAVIVIAVILGYLLNHYVILKAEVPSGSMENTIRIGDRLLGIKIAYLFSEPERGDIVMFDYPDNEEELYVKRIIGLPGETVEIIDGKVYIDGSETPLDEPYLKEQMVGSFGPYEVPEGCYFMLGDNRNISKDSREWTNKYVKKEKIEGKVVLRYSPSISFVK